MHRQRIYQQGLYVVDEADFHEVGAAGILSRDYHLRARKQRIEQRRRRPAGKPLSPVKQMTVVCDDLVGIGKKNFSSWAELDLATLSTMMKTENAPYEAQIPMRVQCEWANGQTLDISLLIGRQLLPTSGAKHAMSFYLNEGMIDGKKVLNGVDKTSMELHFALLRRCQF